MVDEIRHKQGRLESFIEAVFNTALGLALAFYATKAICWVYDIPLSDESNFIIVAWMTVISVLRSFAVRRFFESTLMELVRTHWYRVKYQLTKTTKGK